MPPVDGIVLLPLHDQHLLFAARQLFEAALPAQHGVDPAHRNLARLQRIAAGDEIEEIAITGIDAEATRHVFDKTMTEPVLKGPGTVVTDGNRLYVNSTGNSGLGTGGTGDVLTGLLVSLLGQQIDPFDAACLAVHLHGRAGDLAAADLSQRGMIASDLPQFLTRSFLEFSPDAN